MIIDFKDGNIFSSFHQQTISSLLCQSKSLSIWVNCMNKWNWQHHMSFYSFSTLFSSLQVIPLDHHYHDSSNISHSWHIHENPLCILISLEHCSMILYSSTSLVMWWITYLSFSLSMNKYQQGFLDNVFRFQGWKLCCIISGENDI